jgi:hypothetical protein
MELYFFTAVDDNPKYRQEAAYLIKSGEKFGRKIHLFDIPTGNMWHRYKVKLFATDLPKADRYIYLDSDTVFTREGDWDAPDCQGTMDILYYCPEARMTQTVGFIRNHTICTGDKEAYDYVYNLWIKSYCPIWCNSGVVVLDADVRARFIPIWQKWMDDIDSHCEKGWVEGDEYPLLFARQEFSLPLLPPRFNGCCKWQPIYDWHVLLHADGNVSGPKRIPYDRA